VATGSRLSAPSSLPSQEWRFELDSVPRLSHRQRVESMEL